ncbi:MULTISPECIES: hypothetical protein, partial [unclassified Okeania]|uniref:hypothetical protein n=1 Tax=unclassified Okeania TaxID=2634635 RepID=UPI00257CEFB5
HCRQRKILRSTSLAMLSSISWFFPEIITLKQKKLLRSQSRSQTTRRSTSLAIFSSISWFFPEIITLKRLCCMKVAIANTRTIEMEN